MKNLLGGKGANLAEMVNIGLPVPAGFTITTDVCTYFYNNKNTYPKELKKQSLDALKKVEKIMDAKFGDKKNPLLVSVRSGARASMPGMMDTILNLGLNDTTVLGLIEKTGNPRFAYDSYRRFVQMYGDVVLGLQPENKLDRDPFEIIIEKKKKANKVVQDTELTAEMLKELVAEFKAEIKKKTGSDFPEDPMEQLWGAIGAVFGSWNNDRAIVYRKLNNIPAKWGTAVSVVSMVYGNMGEDSGTGVAFTRDPASGENIFYGEYLFNAQGEDVVAGVRTPLPIVNLKNDNAKVYKELVDIRKILEKHYRDMMDVEFTIQQGKLWMLQCRVGKRTGFAAIKIAVDQVRQKLISKDEALMRIDPEQLNQLLRPVFDLNEKSNAVANGKFLAKGLNAGPGAASGKVAFTAEDAADRWSTVEIDASELTPARLRRIEDTMQLYAFGKGGRAYIINEAHGLRRDTIRQLLVLLERLPSHVCVIFTTTTDGQLKMFEDHIDAHPLLSRCVTVALTSQGLSRPFAARCREIARIEGLDGQPIGKYQRLAQDCKANFRAMLQAVEYGEMMD